MSEVLAQLKKKGGEGSDFDLGLYEIYMNNGVRKTLEKNQKVAVITTAGYSGSMCYINCTDINKITLYWSQSTTASSSSAINLHDIEFVPMVWNSGSSSTKYSSTIAALDGVWVMGFPKADASMTLSIKIE